MICWSVWGRSKLSAGAAYSLSAHVGLYGRSVDPVHFGRMAVITTGRERFDRLVVVVAGRSQKHSGLFTVDERVALLSDAWVSLNNVTVALHDGLLVEIASKVGADVLVRSAGSFGGNWPDFRSTPNVRAARTVSRGRPVKGHRGGCRRRRAGIDRTSRTGRPVR